MFVVHYASKSEIRFRIFNTTYSSKYLEGSMLLRPLIYNSDICREWIAFRGDHSKLYKPSNVRRMTHKTPNGLAEERGTSSNTAAPVSQLSEHRTSQTLVHILGRY